jgi:hypothetical protein
VEQLNIEGKRSGDGFVAHKDTLANALSRSMAERVTLFNNGVTVGRRGFLNYLKALAGNIVKIVPGNGDASGSQVIGKGIKVVCGSYQGYIANEAWVIKDKTEFTRSQIHVSPRNVVMPNLGSIELAEALARVLPFTTSEESKPALQCVKLEVKDGNLTLVSADGFRLAVISLNFANGEDWEALIHRDYIKGLIPALRKAKRARLTVEEKANDGDLLAKAVVIDTELVKYTLPNLEGNFPDYGKVMPTEFSCSASFDTKEAIKASRSLLSTWFDDSTKPLEHPIFLTISDGKVTLEAKEDRGKAEIEAETSGEGKIAMNGKYLLDILKACGGIVSLQMATPQTPMQFNVDSCKFILMPMNIESKPEEEAASGETKEPSKAEVKAEKARVKAEAKAEKARKKAEAKAEAEADVPEDTAQDQEPVTEKEAREAVAVA